LIVDFNNTDNIPYEPVTQISSNVTILVFQPATLQTGAYMFSIFRRTEIVNSTGSVTDLVFEWKQKHTSNLTFEWAVEAPTVKIESIFPTASEISVRCILMIR
jgi:hypothetical protein